MKKVILGFSLVIVIALAVAVYYLLTNLDAIVKAAIEKHGSAATQTAVRVDRVKIILQDGSGTLQGLTVASPKGFAAPNAFSLGQIKTAINLSSLKEEPYIIDEITVRAPQVFLEINNDKKNNLNELKKKLSVGKPTDQPEREADQTADAGPRLIIKRILFTDGNLNALVVPLKNKEYQLKLPTITMNNLGGSKGATSTELATEIIDRLIDAAKKELKKSQFGQELERLKGEAKAKLAEEKAKLKEKEAKAKAEVEAEKAKLKQESDAKLEAEKQKAEDKLKGLFNK